MPSYAEVATKGLIYISPSGTEFIDLRYRVIPQELSRRVQTYEFINIDGTFLQDLGMASKSHSLALYFVGDDHHERANALEAAFAERGAGQLIFPLDETEQRRVLVLKYKRENRYSEAENVTFFEVDFHETIGTVDSLNAKRAIENSRARIDANRKAAQAAQAQAFRSAFPSSIYDNKAIAAIRNRVADARAVFGTALGAVQTAKNNFDSAMTALDTSANLLFEQPLLIAQQIQTALTTPVFPTVSQTLNAYSGFIGGFSDYTRLLGASAKSLFRIDELFVTSAVFAYASNVSSANYKSRSEAVAAFQSVQDAYASAMDYLLAAEAALASERLNRRYYMPPDLYSSMYRSMAAFAGSLDELLLGLRRESIITLDEDMTPLNIAAKFYPDDFRRNQRATTDFVLFTNEAAGDQIFLFEKGSEIKVLT